jgi:hypothetical protein
MLYPSNPLEPLRSKITIFRGIPGLEIVHRCVQFCGTVMPEAPFKNAGLHADLHADLRSSVDLSSGMWLASLGCRARRFSFRPQLGQGIKIVSAAEIGSTTASHSSMNCVPDFRLHRTSSRCRRIRTHSLNGRASWVRKVPDHSSLCGNPECNS